MFIRMYVSVFVSTERVAWWNTADLEGTRGIAATTENHGTHGSQQVRSVPWAHLGDTKGICDCTSVCDSACRVPVDLVRLVSMPGENRTISDDFEWFRCLIGPKKSIDSELDVLFVPGRRADWRCLALSAKKHSFQSTSGLKIQTLITHTHTHVEYRVFRVF